MTEEESPFCRICYTSGDEKLLSPCKCQGSVKYIHQSCWEKFHKSEPSWYTKCGICLYWMETRKVTREEPAATWNVFFYSLGLYIFDGFFRCVVHMAIVVFASYRLTSSLIHTEKQLSWQRLLLCILAIASLGLILPKGHDLLGTSIFGPAFLEESLPVLSKVLDQRKIREMNFGKIARFELPYYTGVFVVIVIIQWLIETLSTMFLSSDISAPTRLPNTVENVNIMNEINDTVLYITVLLAIGGILLCMALNSSITYFSGCFSELYTSASLGRYAWDAIVGLYLDVALIQPFNEKYVANIDRAELVKNERDITKIIGFLVKKLVLSHALLVVHLVFPIITTWHFLPDWLNWGVCHTKGQLPTGTFPLLHFLSSFLPNIEFLVKAVDVILQHALSTSVAEGKPSKLPDDLSVSVESNIALSIVLDLLAWSPLFSAFLTLSFWFMIGLGRLVFHVGLLSSDVYRNDLLVHLGIGLFISYLFFVDVSRTIKSTFKFVGCFSMALSYFFLFVGDLYAPIRVEIFFIIVWLVSYDWWDSFGECLSTIDTFFATSSVIALCSTPWHVLRYNGYDSLENFRWYIMSLIMFAYAIWQLTLLNDRLKSEYDDYVEVLVDYEKPTTTISLLELFAENHGHWSIYNFAMEKWRAHTVRKEARKFRPIISGNKSDQYDQYGQNRYYAI
uniref:RING-CH-type domain-containing protein n=1 Tax=Steinernema glaseri TaxID=37863 RepID=A0A1I8A8Q5_9BILA